MNPAGFETAIPATEPLQTYPLSASEERASRS